MRIKKKVLKKINECKKNNKKDENGFENKINEKQKKKLGWKKNWLRRADEKRVDKSKEEGTHRLKVSTKEGGSIEDMMSPVRGLDG